MSNDASPGIWAQSVSGGKWQMAKHLIQLDQALVRASYQPEQRITVEMPPRHGKSTLTSVYFPAWYRMKFPKRNMMLWSATGRLAQRFSTHARELCHLPLDDRTHSWEHWKIDGTGPNEGEFYSAGIGGGTTMGAGFNIGVIDDYFKDVEAALSEVQRQKLIEWYLTSCVTRAEPGASLVVIATRWHKDDLIGFIKQNAEELGEKWEHIRMPAINDAGEALWPDRWSLKALEPIRRRYALSGYPWMWDALYQQEPPEILDSEWDPRYFGQHIMFDKWPPIEETRFRLITLDPSVGHNNKTDYSAITLGSVSTSGHVYIEADIARRDAERQVNDVLALSMAFGAQAIGVEYTGFQAVMKQMFARRCNELNYWPQIHGIHTRKEKRMKIRGAVTPFLSRGFLKFKRHSPGTSLCLEQLRGFPTHKFDDGPDSLAMLLELAAHVANFGVYEIDDEPMEVIGA